MMTILKEFIKKLKNNGSIYYFDTDTLDLPAQRQADIIADLITSIGKNNIKEVYSLKEFSDLNLEEFNFIILYSDEVKKFIKNSKYLVYYNDKLEDTEKLEDFKKEDPLKLKDKFDYFYSKNSSFCKCLHRVFVNEKLDEIPLPSPPYSGTEIPSKKNIITRVYGFINIYKKTILAISPLIFLLFIVLGSVLFRLQFFPFLISSVVFLILSYLLISALYRKYKGFERKGSKKKLSRLNIWHEIIDILNIILGVTGIKIAKWVYSLLATK